MEAVVEVAVAASVDRVWAVLSDLGQLHAWAPDIVASPSDPLRPGAVRRAHLRKPAYGKDVLVERVVGVGPMHFTYDIEGGIGPLRTIRTTWRARPAGMSSTVRVESTFELQGAARWLPTLARKAWQRQLRALAEALRDHVEDPERGGRIPLAAQAPA